ncbi:RHS repeat protein, partial [bacterium]|nr:RHS repeat protein [bacterium]
MRRIIMLIFIVLICTHAYSNAPSIHNPAELVSTGGEVNLFSGDLNVNLPLMSIPAIGGNLNVNLFYNSNVSHYLSHPDEIGVAGIGWNLGQSYIVVENSVSLKSLTQVADAEGSPLPYDEDFIDYLNDIDYGDLIMVLPNGSSLEIDYVISNVTRHREETDWGVKYVYYPQGNYHFVSDTNGWEMERVSYELASSPYDQTVLSYIDPETGAIETDVRLGDKITPGADAWKKGCAFIIKDKGGNTYEFKHPRMYTTIYTDTWTIYGNRYRWDLTKVTDRYDYSTEYSYWDANDYYEYPVKYSKGAIPVVPDDDGTGNEKVAFSLRAYYTRESYLVNIQRGTASVSFEYSDKPDPVIDVSDHSEIHFYETKRLSKVISSIAGTIALNYSGNYLQNIFKFAKSEEYVFTNENQKMNAIIGDGKHSIRQGVISNKTPWWEDGTHPMPPPKPDPAPKEVFKTNVLNTAFGYGPLGKLTEITFPTGGQKLIAYHSSPFDSDNYGKVGQITIDQQKWNYSFKKRSKVIEGSGTRIWIGYRVTEEILPNGTKNVYLVADRAKFENTDYFYNINTDILNDVIDNGELLDYYSPPSHWNGRGFHLKGVILRKKFYSDTNTLGPLNVNLNSYIINRFDFAAGSYAFRKRIRKAIAINNNKKTEISYMYSDYRFPFEPTKIYESTYDGNGLVTHLIKLLILHPDYDDFAVLSTSRLYKNFEVSHNLLAFERYYEHDQYGQAWKSEIYDSQDGTETKEFSATYYKDRKITETSPNSVVTNYEYGDNNEGKFLTKITGPLGSTEFTYKGDGKLAGKIDYKGRVTQYKYDRYDRLLAIFLPHDEIDTNLDGTISVGDPSAVYAYQLKGEYEITWMDDGSVIGKGLFTENKTFQMMRHTISRTETDAETEYIQTIINYDDFGREVNREREDEDGKVFTFTDYNEYGKPVWKTLPVKENASIEGKKIFYEYNDPYLRLTKTTYPDNNYVMRAYDDINNELTISDSGNHQREMKYDVLGNLIRVVEHNDDGDYISNYEYDKYRGLLKKIIDSRGNETTFSYDWAGRLTATSNPDEGMREFLAYDEMNNLLSKKDGNGNIINYEYDELNRLTKIMYPDNSSVGYNYNDALGQAEANLQDVTTSDHLGNPVTKYSYIYDVRDRIIERNDLYNICGKSFNSRNLFSYTEEDSVKEYKLFYDVDLVENVAYDYSKYTGQIVGVRDLKNDRLLSEYKYNESGNISSIDYHLAASSLTKEYSYDNMMRPANIKVFAPETNTTFLDHSYNYDSVGNRTSLVDTDGLQTAYEYDKLGRLTGVSGPLYDDGDGIGNTYSYDSAGNRLAWKSKYKNLSYEVEADSNRLKKQIIGAKRNIAYGYDQNGNMTEKEHFNNDDLVEKNILSWDYENRLTEYTAINIWQMRTAADFANEDAFSKRVRFKYDGSGMRIATLTDAEKTLDSAEDIEVYFYMLGQVIAKVDGNTQKLKESYVYGNGERILTRRYGYDEQGAMSTTEEYNFTDIQGSLVMTADALTGAVTSRTKYDPYGNLLWANIQHQSSNISEDRYSYTGKEMNA